MLKGAFVLGVLVSIVIFLIVLVALRGFMLWYWRINDLITRLDLILTELKKPSEKA